MFPTKNALKMQFLISLESSSLFFSCSTISFIYYLRDTTFMYKGRDVKEYISGYYTANGNGHHVISHTTLLQAPSEILKYHARGIFLTLILLQVFLEILIDRCLALKNDARDFFRDISKKTVPMR